MIWHSLCVVNNLQNALPYVTSPSVAEFYLVVGVDFTQRRFAQRCCGDVASQVPWRRPEVARQVLPASTLSP